MSGFCNITSQNIEIYMIKFDNSTSQSIIFSKAHCSK